MSTTTANSKSNSTQIKLLVFTGLFTAIIYVLTAYLHVPTIKGYVHVGDGIIFLAAALLPTPYAVFAAAIGGALADALSGYWIWVPATLIIKGVTAVFFTSKKEKILCKQNFIALIPALILCVGGYGLYSGIVIYRNLIAGFADAFANTMQIVTSGILYVILGLALDKIGFKKKMGI
ncbi:MAG: TIGR04002 family protein [Oscillospiraceae bacterium]